MPYDANDRMRVSRVRVSDQGEVREIADCWITINPERKQVGIWTDPEGRGPSLTAPLEDTQIEWLRSEPRNEPYPEP